MPPPNAPLPSDGALPPLVDTHCHLAWPSFGADLDAVVERAREAGVAAMVVVATDVASSRATHALCAGRMGLVPTAGLHPNDLPDPWRPAFDEVAALLRAGGFAAVGETGLDDYRDAVASSTQREAFRAHVTLARELDLPVIVHVRDREGRVAAYDDVATILAETPGVRGVVHCFTGGPAHARRYADLGMYVSFSGILTFPAAENVRAAARVVPLDRLLVETDAPFLAPVPHRGERNEPAFVADTARRLAEVRGLAEADLRRATTDNARRLFGLG